MPSKLPHTDSNGSSYAFKTSNHYPAALYHARARDIFDHSVSRNLDCLPCIFLLLLRSIDGLLWIVILIFYVALVQCTKISFTLALAIFAVFVRLVTAFSASSACDWTVNPWGGNSSSSVFGAGLVYPMRSLCWTCEQSTPLGPSNDLPLKN